MKRSILSIFAIMLTCISLTACQRQDVGMTSGAVLGGVAGSALTNGSTAGTIAGAVGGGYIGREMSR